MSKQLFLKNAQYDHETVITYEQPDASIDQ